MSKKTEESGLSDLSFWKKRKEVVRKGRAPAFDWRRSALRLLSTTSDYDRRSRRDDHRRRHRRRHDFLFVWPR